MLLQELYYEYSYPYDVFYRIDRLRDALVARGAVYMLEDLTGAPARAAVTQSREGAQKEMEAAMGGMNLGGMMDMLGSGGPE